MRSLTLDEVAIDLGISRQALGKWRRRAKTDGHVMVPVGVLNKKTGRMVNGMTPGQVEIIRIMRKAAGQ